MAHVYTRMHLGGVDECVKKCRETQHMAYSLNSKCSP